ncbi:hypothetical protein AtubIFM61612_008470 [Aspergillus tubingensis]|nr:hypothetical protein AtubIFM61612_008470 [Aspergillus tubingensis]
MPDPDSVSNNSSLLFSSDDEHSSGHYDADDLRGEDDDYFRQCHICGYAFYLNRFSPDAHDLNDVAFHHPKKGICKAQKLENLDMYGDYQSSWWMPRRMILHNIKNDGCQISGVTIPRMNYGTFFVPWKKTDGLIYEPRTSEQRRKVVMPMVKVVIDEEGHTLMSGYEDDISQDWMGYPVHARCWELLMHHKLGDIANKNLKVLMLALIQRHEEKSWRRVCGMPDEWFGGRYASLYSFLLCKILEHIVAFFEWTNG